MEYSESASLPGERSHLSMKGTIRTLEKCPKCQCTFKPVIHPHTKDVIDLRCPTCGARPKYYYIDAREFKIGKLYKDKNGRKYDSFLAVHRQLEKMRAQDDDHTLNPDDWVPSKLKEFKFKHCAKDWLVKIEIDKSYSYWRHSRSDMEHHIFPELGDMDVRDVRSKHIDDLYYKLMEKEIEKTKGVKTKLEMKTVDHIMETLKTFLRRCRRLEIINRLPEFPVISVPEKFKGWFNAEKRALALSFIPERHKIIFETLMESSTRPGEVCAHKVKDLIDGEIAIERAFDEKGKLKESKTGKVSYRGLSLQLWEKLVQRSKGKQPESWLFLDEFGKPYSQGRLYDLWKSALKKAGLPHIGLVAGTRRSRASQKRLEMEKKIAEACRKELDHASSETTMKHYARSRKEQL